MGRATPQLAARLYRWDQYKNRWVKFTDATDEEGTKQVKITDGVNDVAIQKNTDDDTNIDETNGLVASSVLYGRIDATKIKPLRMDASTHSLQTVMYEHHEIHAGDHYFVRGVQDLSINNVLGFTWQMPNTTKWTHWTWYIDTEAETAWSIYEGAVVTSALANTITPQNSNRNSTNTSGTTMKFELHANLAAANTKTDVSSATLLSSGIAGAGRTSGSAQRSNELIMKQNTLYCMRATATAAGFINFDMNWYEHTSKD